MTKSRTDTRSTLPRALALNGLTAAIAMALTACGGGGGGEAADVAAPAETQTVLSGVVAIGAPLVGAKLTITDSKGAEVCATEADNQGEYRCTLQAGAAAPFALKASTADHTLYSTSPTDASGIINVTPLTNLMVAKLSSNGNPAKFALGMQTEADLPAKIEALAEELRKLIAPLQAAAGSTAIDPLRGAFKADGTGHDKVLDSLQVSIRPEAESSNIEVTMKVVPASNTAPPVAVAFKSTDTVPSAPAELDNLKAEDLVADGMALRVADFTKRMQDCYALPLAQRVSGVPEGATFAKGGPSAIQAAQCKGLFFNDDPASYKDNGVIVSSSGAYSGIYSEGLNGTRFDMGNFEYLLTNGDVVISFRGVSADGGKSGNYTATLRAQDGKLKAIGNQYDYDATVRPFTSKRHLPRQPQLDHLSTGYNVYIINKVDAQGQPLFKEAKVTTPDGREMLYRPRTGRSNLMLVRANGELSYSGVEVMAAAFIDPSTAGNPANKDPVPVFAAPQLSDEQIRDIPDQGVWTVEWVHQDPSKANVRQSYRTIARAPTIGELRQTPFAQISPSLEAEWMARSDLQTQGRLVFGEPSASQPNVLSIQTSAGADGWQVPDGAIAPVTVLAYSTYGSGSFNDSTNVGTLDRKTTVQCSKQAADDTHCDDSVGVRQFAAGNKVDTVELWGRTIRQVERSTITSFRLL